ncbi:MAG: hypothetical protein ACLGG7_05755, partial [Bacteriovoracia bacterium]
FQKKVLSDEFTFVWPDPEGDTKGILISPLLEALTSEMKKNEDLMQFLSIVEIYRGLGGVRHTQEAQKALDELLR